MRSTKYEKIYETHVNMHLQAQEGRKMQNENHVTPAYLKYRSHKRKQMHAKTIQCWIKENVNVISSGGKLKYKYECAVPNIKKNNKIHVNMNLQAWGGRRMQNKIISHMLINVPPVIQTIEGYKSAP